jgi:hypothetical protein
MAMKYLEGVPDDEVNKITHLNAMRHFRYDPFSVRAREKCTVAALRAESPDVDLSVMRRSPEGTTGPKTPVLGSDLGRKFSKSDD